MSPGADLRAGRARRRLRRLRARAVRRRLPRRRHRAQFVFLSPHARRLHPRGRRAWRSAAPSFPAASAIPSSRLAAIAHYKPAGYVGTPDFLKILLDTAEKAGKDALLVQARAGLRRGAAGSLREELRQRGVAVLQCYAIAETGVIAYESEAREGMIVNEPLIVEIVRPGTGDPVARRRGRRGGGHHVQSRLPDDPARHRRPVRGDGRAARPAAAPTCASRAGWAAPTRPPRSRACSCIPPGRRSGRAPSASSRVCGSSSRAPTSRTR